MLRVQALRHAVDKQRIRECALDGCVHSVFRHAVNFLMADDRFVTLILEPKPLAPEGIQVRRDAFRQTGLGAGAALLSVNGLLPFAVGEKVRLQTERLTCGEVVVEFASADIVDLSVGECAVCDSIRQALSLWLPTVLQAKGLMSGLRGEALGVNEDLNELNGLLWQIVQTDEPRRLDYLDKLGCLLERFIGLGEGLTPSGDDFLVGLMWSFWVDRKTREALQLVFRAALRTRVNKTNSISAQMLQYAACARFTEPLVRLFRADEQTDFHAAFENIAAFGHTSGLDTLCGLLAGLNFSAHLKISFHKSAPTASNSTAATTCVA